jgi:glutamine amidotransferase
VIGTSSYGIEFASAIEKENIIAFQFHPEKSGEYGLALLRNFFALD